MGLGLGSGMSASVHDKTQKIEGFIKAIREYEGNAIGDLLNPNPKRFNVITEKKIGDLTIAKVNYPDCTNYEGNKILVMKSKYLAKAKNKGTLDPHFCKDESLSPVARFAPTKDGWHMALLFAEAYVRDWES